MRSLTQWLALVTSHSSSSSSSIEYLYSVLWCIETSEALSATASIKKVFSLFLKVSQYQFQRSEYLEEVNSTDAAPQLRNLEWP